MTESALSNEFTPKMIKNSFVLDQEIVLNINNLIQESQLNPPAVYLKSYDNNASNNLYQSNSNFRNSKTNVFDSVIDFDSDKPEFGSLEQRYDKLNRYQSLMKTERNKLVELLKQCDNERVLFRKFNLELLKLVVEQKNEDICGA